MDGLEEFRRLFAVVAAGRLRPAVERCFALEEAPGALDHLASGGQWGKLTVRIG